MSRSRRMLATLVLLLAALVPAELLARLVFPVPEVRNFNRIHFTLESVFGGLDEVAKTGGRPVEDFAYSTRKPLRNVQIEWIADPDGVRHPVSLNLYGFRGPTFEIEKAPGTRRVIFLGDSFTEGFGAHEDETLPAVFQRELGEPDLEMLNLGIGGTDLPIMSLLAGVAIPLLQPDYVVLVVYDNDLPALPLADDWRDPHFVPVYTKPWIPRLLSTTRDLLTGQTPALFYRRGPFPFFRGVPHRTNPLTGESRDPDIPEPIWQALREGRLNPFLPALADSIEPRLLMEIDEAGSGRPHLAHIRSLCSRHGASFLVGYIPVNVTVSDRYIPFWEDLGARFEHASLATPGFRRHQEALGEAARSLSIPFVDTTDLLAAEEARGRQQFLGYDGHLTVEGYELVGRALARRFREAYP